MAEIEIATNALEQYGKIDIFLNNFISACQNFDYYKQK
jgi:hypothetical protein